MGFETGFRETQATEDYVTIQDGLLAGATTNVIADLRQRLEDWYDEQSSEDRERERERDVQSRPRRERPRRGGRVDSGL
jgi:hypothetical protein